MTIKITVLTQFVRCAATTADEQRIAFLRRWQVVVDYFETSDTNCQEISQYSEGGPLTLEITALSFMNLIRKLSLSLRLVICA